MLPCRVEQSILASILPSNLRTPWQGKLNSGRAFGDDVKAQALARRLNEYAPGQTPVEVQPRFDDGGDPARPHPGLPKPSTQQ
jgi:hypothetical protein